MENNLITLKSYNLFIVKKNGAQDFEITPYKGEKFLLKIIPFNMFKKDFIYFKIADNYLGKFFMFIRKSELYKIKIELFLETTFKHSIYFYINYDGEKLYNFFFPIQKVNLDFIFMTIPDFDKIEKILELIDIKVVVKITEDIKTVITNINYTDIFLEFCKKNLDENEYNEVRLLWEIL